jgi:hypothetical protein
MEISIGSIFPKVKIDEYLLYRKALKSGAETEVFTNLEIML